MSSNLESLANELLLTITDYLPAPSLSALTRTNRLLHLKLTYELYHRAAFYTFPEPHAYAGHTVLQWAVEQNRLALVAALLKHHADVNVRTPHFVSEDARRRQGFKGWSRSRAPLQIAVARGFTEIVEILLDHGAAIEDAESGTLLHWAGMNLDLPMARLLLKYDQKAGIGLVTAPGRSMMSAHHSPINSCLWALDKSRETPERIGRRYEMVELLLDHGAPVNSVGASAAENVLNQALKYGCRDVRLVRLLLERGAEITAAGVERGMNALTQLVEELFGLPVDIELLQLLLEFATERDLLFKAWSWGRTPLGLARKKGRMDVADMIWKKMKELGLGEVEA